jgi:tyrosyl-tRNA synthetase
MIEQPLGAQDGLELIRRGLVEELPRGELDARAAEGSMRVKLGLDPTASRVHLGWAVVLRKLRHFQEAGHVAVLVVGDYTAQIGDPSGKSSTRKRLSAEEVSAYADQCLALVKPLLLPTNLEIRFNSEWLAGLHFDEVLRLLSTATVSQILERDDFSKRFAGNQPISLVEFVYPLLQGYDSVQLQADVELGGNDQLFNILMGRTLQTAYGQRPQIVCTVPLLVGLDGKEKMSQSLGNDVAVDEEPDEMFGKLMSIPDHAIVDYCRLGAWWPTDRVEVLERDLASGREPAVRAKRSMARSIVDLYHGDGVGRAAEAAFDRIHVRHEAPEDIDERSLSSLLGNGETITLVDLLVLIYGGSKSEARRLLGNGGVRLDDKKQFDDRELTSADLGGVVLQRGKRQFIRITDD